MEVSLNYKRGPHCGRGPNGARQNPFRCESGTGNDSRGIAPTATRLISSHFDSSGVQQPLYGGLRVKGFGCTVRGKEWLMSFHDIYRPIMFGTGFGAVIICDPTVDACEGKWILLSRERLKNPVQMERRKGGGLHDGTEHSVSHSLSSMGDWGWVDGWFGFLTDSTSRPHATVAYLAPSWTPGYPFDFYPPHPFKEKSLHVTRLPLTYIVINRRNHVGDDLERGILGG